MKNRLATMRGFPVRTILIEPRPVLIENPEPFALVSRVPAHAMVVTANSQETLRLANDGSTIFFNNGQEMFRFHRNGHVYVKGKLVTEESEIYHTFRKWLESLGLTVPA